MTVKRYDDTKGGMLNHENGAFVTYSDYQKLVAERDDFKKSSQYSAATNKKIVATNIRLSDENTELKSDAAIAEIKALGVDEFAASEDAKVEKWLAGDEYANYASKMAEEFAANLRAERKG